MISKFSTDVDIDVFNRDKILENLDCAFGRVNERDKHNTGVYFQNIPKDPETNISTIDYKTASDLGYFKIDFLNVNIYEKIKSEDHLKSLLDKEPPWDFFEYSEITEKLFHLNGHSKLLQKFKPKSIEDLSIILAIIRPSKAYLQSEAWDRVKQEVWIQTEEDSGYVFKRGHAISYSIAICVHLHLILEEMQNN